MAQIFSLSSGKALLSLVPVTHSQTGYQALVVIIIQCTTSLDLKVGMARHYYYYEKGGMIGVV